MSSVRRSPAGTGQLNIRPARARDLDEVLTLERLAFSDPWSRSAFTSLLGDPRVYFVVACDDEGRVVGYLAAWFVAPEGEIATLAVKPEARRLGIGARLLDAVVDAARLRGVHDLYLEVRESNEAARRLYASRGFVEVGRRRGYYRNPVEDARVLRSIVEL